MKHLLMHSFFGLFLCLIFGLGISACSEENDCSLTSRSMGRFNFLTKSTLAEKKIDTLSVTALNTDSVLVNKDVLATYESLPLSYTSNTTTFIFHYSETERDTLWVSHQNIAHFVSMECGTTMFHHLDSVRCTYNIIDSIAISNPEIDNNEKENIRIFY